MRQFVLLATRAEDLPADEEYAAFLRAGGLRPEELVRVRLERDRMPALDLDAISGIIVGGGPFNASDPAEAKSAVQRRVETEMARLLDEVVARDTPLLGACYGIGTVGVHQGGTVDATYAEPIGVADVALTDAGRADPLCAQLPAEFGAFVGHKEAVRRLPAAATVLAGSATCPVQMFRVGENVYATQFHPELDLAGIRTRINAYAGYGYYRPEQLPDVLAAVERRVVTHPPAIVRAFVERYAR